MNLLHESLKNDKICLSYLGSFDDEITAKLIGISEAYLDNQSELSKLKNKVSFLIAECFQNIIKHRDVKDNIEAHSSYHSDFFQINSTENRTILTSCNLVDCEHAENLEQKLIKISSLNASELKQIYAEVLGNEGFSDKGGAGLGLIEMARKSSLPIKYFFNPLDAVYKQFYLFLEIHNKKETEVTPIKIKDGTTFHQLLLSEKVMMLYKGDFSSSIITPLIDMLQNNFTDRTSISGKEKRIIITLIEVLQNISKHGKKMNDIKQGVFNIAKSDNSYIIEAGNYVEENQVETFKNTMLSLKNMNLEELNVLYKERLLQSQITPEGNCGLGLLEIARNAYQNFDYAFTTSENNHFYSLKIKI